MLLEKAVLRMRRTTAVLVVVLVLVGLSVPGTVRLPNAYIGELVTTILEERRPNLAYSLEALVGGLAIISEDLPRNASGLAYTVMSVGERMLGAPLEEAAMQSQLVSPCGNLTIITPALELVYINAEPIIDIEDWNESSTPLLTLLSGLLREKPGAFLLPLVIDENGSRRLIVLAAGSDRLPLVVGSPEALKCIGVDPTPLLQAAREGDGILTAIIPADYPWIVERAQGPIELIPQDIPYYSGLRDHIGMSVQASMGAMMASGELDVQQGPVPEVTPAPGGGVAVAELPVMAESGSGVALYTLPSELSDLDGVLGGMNQDELVAEAVARLGLPAEAFLFGKRQPINSSMSLIDSLESVSRQLLLLPSLELANYTSSGGADDTIRGVLGEYSPTVPDPRSSLSLAYVKVLNYEPARAASMSINEISGEMSNFSLTAAEKIANATPPECSVLVTPSSEPGRLSGKICQGLTLSTVSNVLPVLIDARREIMTNAITMVAMVSLTPLILLMGWTMVGESIRLIIGYMRRWAAAASARGATLYHVGRPLLVIALAGGLAAGLLGLVLAGAVIDGVYSGLGVLQGVRAVLRDPVAVLLGAALVPAVVVASSYSALRALRSVRPIEAVRPVESIRMALAERRAKLQSFLAFLTAIAILLGVARPDIEAILESASGPAAALVYFIAIIGFLFAPFSPLLVVYLASPLVAGSGVIQRAGDRLASLIAGKLLLGRFGEASGSRIRSLMLGLIGSAVLGYAIVVGAALASVPLSGDLALWMRDNAGFGGGVETYASALSASGLLRFLSLLAGAVTAVLVYGSVASVFEVMQRQVAVLQARGAPRRAILGYVYTGFLPSIVTIIVGGLVVGMLFIVAMDAVVGITLIDMWGKPTPHLVPGLDRIAGLLILVPTLLVLLIPLLVAWRATGVRSLASILRGG